ncbi:hypothetical protein BGI33_05720 [Snodgrassella alvi]|uniref:Uncharacterized protein n=1 Tax=Snodgrassella alvi TaxID=1196083 RepID=A0A2N9WRJ0_9NEIS|nr:hypothetical protein BGI32_11185 [Snodgrassella alvi]PIT15646.1 hypothetical protein BGI33_05720 [Snodgrassella alvi]PIT18685.1 hypothetical protein BGI34_03840 [Snodgrassella alvi]
MKSTNYLMLLLIVLNLWQRKIISKIKIIFINIIRIKLIVLDDLDPEMFEIVTSHYRTRHYAKDKNNVCYDGKRSLIRKI